MSLEKVVYTAKAKATGGRDGRATSPMAYWTSNWVCQKRWAAWGRSDQP
jgi:hypothetical protein